MVENSQKVDSQRCMIKTVVWMRIDQCVFDDNKSAYFLKCTSVDNPWPKIRVAENVNALEDV